MKDRSGFGYLPLPARHLFIWNPRAQPLAKIGGVKAELSHAILNFGNAHE
jgi:hypothetical protein